MKALDSVPRCVPSDTTTSTAPDPCWPVIVVSCVDETICVDVAATPPNVTLTPAAKFVPVTVTLVPPRVDPLLGVTTATEGTGPGGVGPAGLPPPHDWSSPSTVSVAIVAGSGRRRRLAGEGPIQLIIVP